MSCYQVSPAHIARMIAIAAEINTGAHTRWTYDRVRFDLGRQGCEAVPPMLYAREVFTALSQANANSVASRYREWDTTEPVPFEEPRNVTIRTRADLAAAVKVVDCYVYQSCEAASWEASPSRKFCTALREALIAALLGADYSEAPWGITSQAESQAAK